MCASNPSVSICIPIYNGEAHLRPCLDSVLAQTAGDVEILAVDDGSSDGSVALLNEYARQDSRLQVVRNDANLGLVGNWGRCIGLARGRWIKFVFQDDVIQPDAVTLLLDAATAAGKPLAFGRRDFIFEAGVSEDTRRWYERGAEAVRDIFPVGGAVAAEAFCRLVLERPSQNFIGEPVAVLFERSLLERIGPFNAHLAVFCDMEFWMRAGVNHGAAHCAERVASFRVHDASTTARSVKARRYRMDVLDHVVVAHEFAFHPAFAALREQARQQGVDLRRRFGDMARWAYGLAGAKAQDELSLATLGEWQAVARAYPRIRAVGLGEQLAGKRRSVVRRAGALARSLQRQR
ncbi:hypothetical protein CLD22_00065 [Rubrivivax gelatinosus]|nr:hypothetical protein [Rubrivivax gelatinosus]